MNPPLSSPLNMLSGAEVVERRSVRRDFAKMVPPTSSDWRNIYQPVPIHVHPSMGYKLFPRILWTGYTASHSNMVLKEYQHLQSQYTRRRESIQLLEGRTPLLLSYHPSTPYMFKYALTSKLPKPDILFYMEAFFGHCMVDRTGTLLRCAKAKILDPIPPLDPKFNMSITDVCLQRARQIYNRAVLERRRIKVLWSGGIDSTTALVALLRVISQSNQNIITVIYTRDSVKEYQLFFHRYISLKLSTQEVRNLEDVHRRLGGEPEFLLVTGQLGDQIFGSTCVKYCFQTSSKSNLFSGKLHESWRTFMPNMLVYYGAIPRDAGQAWLRWIEPQVACSPIPIKNVFDMLWWIDFSLKWQHITLQLLKRQRNPNKEMYLMTEHFFGSEEFQQWSYRNHSRKISDPTNWKTYKMDLKNFIFEFTNDSRYRDEKRKEQSLKRTNGIVIRTEPPKVPHGIGFDENFNIVSFGKYSMCVDMVREKYGDNLASILTSEEHMEDQLASGPAWISADASAYVRNAFSIGYSFRRKESEPLIKGWHVPKIEDLGDEGEAALLWAFNYRRVQVQRFQWKMNRPRKLEIMLNDEDGQRGK